MAVLVAARPWAGQAAAEAGLCGCWCWCWPRGACKPTAARQTKKARLMDQMTFMYRKKPKRHSSSCMLNRDHVAWPGLESLLTGVPHPLSKAVCPLLGFFPP